MSLLHPRLLHGLALIEPVIQEGAPSGPNAALPSSYRRDLWSSRSEAEESLRKNKYFQTWDARALANYLRYGLRDAPTAIYPLAPETDPVTLTTTKHQEAWSFVRSNFAPMTAGPDDRTERWVAPDLDAENRTHLFHRAEMGLTFRNLPLVRPSVLWVFGAESYINTPASRDEKMALTGTGIGGNGGGEISRVEKVVVEKAGHMLPFENVQDCASILARWLGKVVVDFEAEEAFHREHHSGRSERDMLVTSDRWMANVRLKARERRIIKENL